MARTKGLPQKDTFTTNEIFEAVIDYYDLNIEYEAHKEEMVDSETKRDNFREKILTAIRRSMKDNYIEPMDHKKNKNGNYYSWEAFKKLMDAPDFKTYCRKLAIKSQAYKTNAMLLQEQQDGLDDKRELYHERLDRVGVQNIRLPKGRISSEQADAIFESDANVLAADMLKNDNERLYLRIDELEFLGLKGLHKRANLSDDEKSLLQRYSEHLLMDEAEAEEIEERFFRTKLELMITTLFEAAGFSLDEDQLYKDISNSVRGGDFTTVLRDKSGTKDVALPIPHVRKSYLRLQEMKYVKKEK